MSGHDQREAPTLHQRHAAHPRLDNCPSSALPDAEPSLARRAGPWTMWSTFSRCSDETSALSDLGIVAWFDEIAGVEGKGMLAAVFDRCVEFFGDGAPCSGPPSETPPDGGSPTGHRVDVVKTALRVRALQVRAPRPPCLAFLPGTQLHGPL